jgi:hypothetical protein
VRHLFVPLLALEVAALAPNVARADEPVATAKIECAPVPEPGRVRCEVETRATHGRSIQWADVVVERAPPFTAPLRARVGPLDASAREEGVWRWAIALAAKSHGTGALDVRVRVVVCPEGGARTGACVPVELTASTAVTVGP